MSSGLHCLILCTGNICRSPLAEILLRERLAGYDANISSAGIQAPAGAPADPRTVALLQARGLAALAHRSRRIEARLAREAALLLVMERRHKHWLEQRWPWLRGRVMLWDTKGADIPDPYRSSLATYTAMLHQIETSLDDWTDKLRAVSRYATVHPGNPVMDTPTNRDKQAAAVPEPSSCTNRIESWA